MINIFECRKRFDQGRVIKWYKFLNFTIFKIDFSEYKRYSLFGIRIFKIHNKNFKSDFFVGASGNVLQINNIENVVKLRVGEIEKIISQDEIKIISFDIFDTLLYRPVLDPKDIFYLIASKVDKKFGINFVKVRWDAEEKINNINATIDDIYLYIKDVSGLSDGAINEIMNEEKMCEYDLLQPRLDIMEIYQKACQKGKKIIAVSDMYLPEDFLEKLLCEKGYKNINKVFVSNKYKCRKDNGGLYDVVMRDLNVAPCEICHIGDNYQSDYMTALKKGIVGIYYPSIKDIVFSKGSIYNAIWDVRKISNDPYTRILMGYAIFNTFSTYESLCGDGKVFGSLLKFSRLFLSPLLVFIICSIIFNEEIIKERKRIIFLSRDGYLPKIVYDIFGKYIKIPESVYLYSGRRAYFSSMDGDVFSYLKKYKSSHGYSIKNFLNAFFEIDGVADKIIRNLSDREQNESIDNRKECVSILRRFEKDINDYIAKHKKNVAEYYNDIFSIRDVKRRDIVFDCGYSGSIGRAIGDITGKCIDKIYLWETPENKILDKQSGSKTFALFGDLENKDGIVHIVLEELFSPCEGGVLGFDKGKPIIENVDFDESMKMDVELIHREVCDFVRKYCDTFKKYLGDFVFSDFNVLFQSYEAISSAFKANAEYSLFENIVFPDPVYFSEQLSLSQKISNSIKWDDVFDGTGFTSYKKSRLYGAPVNFNGIRIGIHIHLFNFYLYNEFVCYLVDFPEKFDLILTVNAEEYVNIARSIFNKNVIDNLDKLIIKVVPNKGRDVAPLLVFTKDEQDDYDVFCHLHAKVSAHIGFGDEWRQYLLQKLLGKEYISNILHAFKDEDVGLVFPEPFEKLKKMCIEEKIKQEGEFGERNLISDLMQKMGIVRPLNRSDIVFSEGTMFWYRTSALKQLFDLDFSLDDFPDEPVGVGGTIMHAIERMPAIICKENKKKVLIF